MYCVRKLTDDLYWVGVNDKRLSLFENIHPIPKGVSYNSYVLLDEKTVLIDTADWAVCRQFLDNVAAVLDGRDLDYLIINHMEPDHAASLEEILIRYPNVKIIATEKAFMLMNQFGFDGESRKIVVKEGDKFSFGKHEFVFVEAPMVHWPEVMVSYDATDKVLFSADAFGTFGSLDGKIFNDEMDFDRDWLDEARRYYTNIVGKYGPFVQKLLKKASALEIKMICPLHGPVWRNNFEYFIDKHDKWSSYTPEKRGVVLVYGSMYGNTESAAQALATKLVEKGVEVVVHDVSNTNVSYLISDAFKYSNIVLACVTYNLGIYPPMHAFLEDMKALALQKRNITIVENGSWAIKSGDLITDFVEKELKQMNIVGDRFTVTSKITNDAESQLDSLVDAIVESVNN